MHPAFPILAIVAVAGFAHTEELPSRDNRVYLTHMCFPQTSDAVIKSGNLMSVLSQSPFPCEQAMYLGNVCFTNGTTLADFAAEQQCLCGGNFFDALIGCDKCQDAHGRIGPETDQASERAKYSKLECDPTQVTKPFTNLYPPQDVTSMRMDADATLMPDPFADDTRVENYWTGVATPIAGQITVAATGGLTTFTNTGDATYTPTSAAASETTAIPSPSTSAAGAGEIKATSGLLAVIVGAIAML